MHKLHIWFSSFVFDRYVIMYDMNKVHYILHITHVIMVNYIDLASVGIQDERGDGKKKRCKAA